jgi:crotonobetainyl-CoA:carnitine CoA-transferase CaiB-like acyl-CoA transferase
VFGNPIHLSDNKPIKPTSAPLLGQDNDAVFQELLGLGPEQIKVLRDQKLSNEKYQRQLEYFKKPLVSR